MTVPFPTLSLTYDTALVPKEGEEVLRSPAAPVKSLLKEPAGHLYHAAALLSVGFEKMGEFSLILYINIKSHASRVTACEMI